MSFMSNVIKISEQPEGNESPACPICEKFDSVRFLYQKAGYYIHRCRSCSHMFVDPQPEEKELIALYDDSYFKRGNKYERQSGDCRYDPNYLNDLERIRLVRNYKAEGSLLDVGCAQGGFLEVAQQSGYKVQGVEVSTAAASVAIGERGLKVVNSDLVSAGFEDNIFDIITLWDVIEHLQNPAKTITEAYRILRPGGIILVSTGDAASRWAKVTGRYWQLMTPPQHLAFYSSKSLIKFFQKHNFVVRHLEHPGKRSRVDFILFKARETFGKCVTPLQILANVFGFGSKRVYLNLYDIMVVLAEKKMLGM